MSKSSSGGRAGIQRSLSFEVAPNREGRDVHEEENKCWANLEGHAGDDKAGQGTGRRAATFIPGDGLDTFD